MQSPIEALEKLLAAGRDDAVLRFSLGSAYLTLDPARAIAHLEHAVRYDPHYSAAWKFLGKALAACGDEERAREVFSHGITVAESKKDVQAVKEMRVFLKRLSHST